MIETCTICGEEMSKRIIKLSKEWETDTDICSCELLTYVKYVEDKLKTQRKEIIKEFMSFVNVDNANPCMKCGSVQCAICGYELLNYLHKLNRKRMLWKREETNLVEE